MGDPGRMDGRHIFSYPGLLGQSKEGKNGFSRWKFGAGSPQAALGSRIDPVKWRIIYPHP
jgi:hypothetical protein